MWWARARYPFNTLWPRFLAHVVDGIMFWPATFVVQGLGSTSDQSELICATIYFAILFLYRILLTWLYGGTLGKLFCDVKVFDILGGRITFNQAFLRESVHIGIALVVFALALTSLLLGIPFDDSFPPTGKPLFYLVAKWVSLVLFNGWFLAEIVVALLNDQRRPIHDLIARTVVVRYD